MRRNKSQCAWLGYRTYLILWASTFLSSFSFLFLSSSPSFATIHCASRPLVQGELKDFRDGFRTYIANTTLLGDSDAATFRTDKGDRETYFSRLTRIYFESDFHPRDTVCIVSGNESAPSLEAAGVWDTFSGTLVVLAPFPVSPRGNMYRSSKVSLVDYFAAEVSKSKTSEFESLCKYKSTFEFKVDGRCVNRRLAQQTAQYLSEIKHKSEPAPNQAIAYAYRADRAEVRQNSHAYEAFVTSVAEGALEATNYPFYAKHQVSGSDRDLRRHSVYDPLTSRRLPVTSLKRFVGLNLVETSMRHLFDWFFALEDQLARTEAKNLVQLEVNELETATEWTFPFSDALDQMKRAYICANDGRSGLDLSALDFDSVLLSYRRVACPELRWETRQVIDLTKPLRRATTLDAALAHISRLETRNRLNRLLTELQAMTLEQTTSIRGIEKVVTQMSFDQRIGRLKTRVEELKAGQKSFVEQFAEVGFAMTGLVTGGSVFLTGLEGVKQVYKELEEKNPAATFSQTIKFFWKNREDFSEATNLISSGSGEVMQSVRAIEGFLSQRDESRSIEALQEQISDLVAERKGIVGAIEEASAGTEAVWRRKVEDVYQATVVEQSLIRNVSILLHSIAARNTILGVVVDEVPLVVNECAASLKHFWKGRKDFNPVPILLRCGGGESAIAAIQRCLVESGRDEGMVVGFQTNESFFVIGRETSRVDCYRPRVGLQNRRESGR